METLELLRLLCGVVMVAAILAAGVFCTYGYGRWWA